MDGRSLIPFAKDPLMHSGRDLLLETPTYAAVRSPNWLYAEHVTGEKELYNLARDRDELNSLQMNPSYDRVERDLASRLARLRHCAGAVCRRGPELGLRARTRHARGGGCRTTSLRLSVGGGSLSGPVAGRKVALLAKPSGSLLEVLVTLTDSRRQTLSRRIGGCPS